MFYRIIKHDIKVESNYCTDKIEDKTSVKDYRDCRNKPIDT